MTCKLILMKARQSRIAALESLEGSSQARRQKVKTAVFRTRRIRDRLAEEDAFFRALDAHRLAA